MAYADSGIRLFSGEHVCPHCKGRHRDPQYKMCGVCRDLTAAYHRVYRDDHRKRGLCTECIERRRKGEYIPGERYMKCQHHIDYHRDWNAEHRASKRKAGLCVYGACQNRTSSYLCDLHAEQAYARKAKRTGRPYRKAA